MTVLVPMREELFARFAEESIADYADDNTISLRWLPSEAAARAQREFHALLPQGLRTAGHTVYEILDAPGGTMVGWLWFAISDVHGVRSGYIFSIKLAPQYRGRGHAKEAIDLIERRAHEEGLVGIALHVFSFNASAHALYRSLGYGITGFNMIKPLRRDDAPAP